MRRRSTVHAPDLRLARELADALVVVGDRRVGVVGRFRDGLGRCELPLEHPRQGVAKAADDANAAIAGLNERMG